MPEKEEVKKVLIGGSYLFMNGSWNRDIRENHLSIFYKVLVATVDILPLIN